jgi:hypothetical protein
VSVDKTYEPIRFELAAQFWKEDREIPVFDIDDADVKRLSTFGLAAHPAAVPFTPTELALKKTYEDNATVSAHAQSAAIADSLTKLLEQGKDREIEDLRRQLTEARAQAVVQPVQGRVATPTARKARRRAPVAA